MRARLLQTLDFALRHTPGGWLVARWHARRVRRALYGVRAYNGGPFLYADTEGNMIVDPLTDNPTVGTWGELEALRTWLDETRGEGFDMRVVDSLLAVSSLPDGSPASVLSLPADVTPEGVRPLCLCQCGHIYADECGCLYAQMLIPPEDRRPVWPDEMKIPRS